MESEALLKLCLQTLEDRKAQNIIAYDMRGHSSLTDFYVFCSGTSRTQLRAFNNYIGLALKDLGMLPRSTEGDPDSGWILLDLNDVLIHIFHVDQRSHYNVEELLDNSLKIYPEETTEDA